MSELLPYLWLIPALPFGAAVLVLAFGKLLGEKSHLPVLAATLGSCVLAVLVLQAVGVDTGPQGEPINTRVYYTWFKAGEIDVGVSMRADSLTAIMLVMVTFIGSLIVLYSSGYMHGDPGYPRFFAEVGLFIASMTGLVLADNILLLYAFWEGVGLCSYLLIGFWFQKPSAADAARKAFLVTRLGDCGFFLGILLLWVGSGGHTSFDTLFPWAVSAHAADRDTIHPLLVAATLLLFCGAVGKSAQFPLHVWLPDAMEGPTPVSALIHAATMVTAGVYLIARCTPLFALVPEVQMIVATVGGISALLAALIALTQTDLKRVLAYSTISQLGYMFMAVGCGAVTAGMFHLVTHAFFKALLFLAAGSVMHAMGGVIDMRRFSGLRKVLPVTHLTFLAGAAALSGFPFITAGFWSKDEILAGLYLKGEHDHSTLYTLLYVIGLGTAALTAFYTFRAYFLTFWGEERIPDEAGHHAHESPAVMTVPLIILAAGAILVGFLNPAPFREWFGEYLTQHTPHLADLHHEAMTTGTLGLLWTLSIIASLGGIGAAYWVYVKNVGVAEKMVSSAPLAYEASLNKFWFDDLYFNFIVAPLNGFAEFCRIIDSLVVDGVVDLVGHVPRLGGLLFRDVQNGLVQFYALAMALGLVVFLLALVRSIL